MGLNVQTNVSSLEAARSVGRNQKTLNSSFNKLSSGFRVNTAADDAAGLAISESMKSQIRSYTVAERNANDGISMAQTAEGALGEIHEVLGRMRELAMQASNDSLGAEDRQYLDNEFQSLNQEIGRIQESTQFSGNKLISGTESVGTLKFQVGLTDDTNDQIEVSFANLDFGVSALALTDGDTARTVLTQIDAGIDNVSQARATFGTAVNRLEVASNNIQTMRLNISAANSRIRDVDVADESAKMAKSQVLSQSSVSILAQANQLPQLAYKLIGG